VSSSGFSRGELSTDQHHPLLADESGCGHNQQLQQPQKIVISTETSVTQFNWVRIVLLTLLVVVLLVVVFALGLFLGEHFSDEKSASEGTYGYSPGTTTSFRNHKHIVPIKEDEPAQEKNYSPKSGIKAAS